MRDQPTPAVDARDAPTAQPDQGEHVGSVVQLGLERRTPALGCSVTVCRTPRTRARSRSPTWASDTQPETSASLRSAAASISLSDDAQRVSARHMPRGPALPSLTQPAYPSGRRFVVCPLRCSEGNHIARRHRAVATHDDGLPYHADQSGKRLGIGDRGSEERCAEHPPRSVDADDPRRLYRLLALLRCHGNDHANLGPERPTGLLCAASPADGVGGDLTAGLPQRPELRGAATAIIATAASASTTITPVPVPDRSSTWS